MDKQHPEQEPVSIKGFPGHRDIITITASPGGPIQDVLEVAKIDFQRQKMQVIPYPQTRGDSPRRRTLYFDVIRQLIDKKQMRIDRYETPVVVSAEQSTVSGKVQNLFKE